MMGFTPLRQSAQQGDCMRFLWIPLTMAAAELLLMEYAKSKVMQIAPGHSLHVQMSCKLHMALCKWTGRRDVAYL